MTINRHNYEEFFLLYVDNELQQEARVLVEKFVEQHPDLASELEMLQQATLQNDAVVFEDKLQLYKTQSGICLSNYEEYFVLAVDNELSAEEMADVERFVLQHPQLQQEFMLLRQSKLEPEAVIFRGKAKLYRNEKQRRVVPFTFLRISVAAALLGLIVMTWLYTSDRSQQVSPAAAKQVAKSLNKTFALPPSKAVTQQEPAALNTVKTIDKIADNMHREAEKVKVKAGKNLLETGTATVVGNNKQGVSGNESLRDPDKNELAIVRQQPAAEKMKEPELTVENDETTKTLNDFRNTLAVNDKIQKTSMISNAVYLDTDDSNDEDKSIYIGNAAINKNKLKGLFKKASVLFRKKNIAD